MNKKGSIVDILYWVIASFAVAVFVVTVFLAFSQIRTAFNAATTNTDAQQVMNRYITFLERLDWLVFFIVMGLIILIIILASVIPTHPALSMMVFIILLGLTYVSMHISNSYHAFATSTGVETYANNFPITNYILLHLPLFVLSLGVLFVIIQHAKPQGGALI